MRGLLCVFAEAWNGFQCFCVCSLRRGMDSSAFVCVRWGVKWIVPKRCDPIIVQKYPFIWISRLIIPNVIFTWFPKDNPKSISIGVERLKHRLISSDTLLLFPKCFMKCEMEILKVVMMKRYDFVKFDWILRDWIDIEEETHCVFRYWSSCPSFVVLNQADCELRRGCWCGVVAGSCCCWIWWEGKGCDCRFAKR